ncbi:MAG: hypothetical protein LBT46_07900 [Planctomycetaceae bacterium]|jgi:hypothetical protein|nr:hypothetical protein [Planctomycetaceae bacterium]
MSDTSGVKAGRAYVEFFAQDGPLIRGMQSMSRRLSKFSDSCYALAKKTALHLAVISGPILLAAKQFMDFGDKVEKMSQRTGMGARAISELGYAAQLCELQHRRAGCPS